MRTRVRPSALVAVAGLALLVSGAWADLNPLQQQIMGFENASQWTRATENSTTHSEGNYSAVVPVSGWTEVTSVPLSTIGPVDGTVSVDILLPAETPYWGEARVIVKIPSQSEWYRELGSQSLVGRSAGDFHTLQFSIPPDLASKFEASYSDLTFTVVINAPAGDYLLDGLWLWDEGPPEPDGGGFAGAAGAGGSEPSCHDGLQNGDESDVDCGGSCAPCAPGQGCSVDADCENSNCTDGTCETAATCSDGLHNGDETDVDCGGSCPGCPEWHTCSAASDCLSGACVDGYCRPQQCNDGVQNGEETDVDCGGSACDACGDGSGCLQSRDCQSRNCGGGICQAATCDDGISNGDETATDCGGDTCPACPDRASCDSDADCQSGNCWGGLCHPASTCSNGVRDGYETDVDCGGNCGLCRLGDHCLTASDCESWRCRWGICKPARCEDGIKNDTETGVDCGGHCPPCADGQRCSSRFDCQSMNCCGGSCQPLDPPPDGCRCWDEACTKCLVDFRIWTPSGIAPGETALGAVHALTVSDGVAVRYPDGTPAGVATTGAGGTNLGVESMVGSVTSPALVTLRNRATVYGDIRSKVPPDLWDGAAVTGQQQAPIRHGAGVSMWYMALPRGCIQNVNLEPDGNEQLDPGNYGSVTINPRAQLHLSAGTYSFRSLTLESESELTLDTTKGDIEIFISGGLIYRGRLVHTNGDASNVLIAVAGGGAIAVESAWTGATLVAPNASVQLRSAAAGHVGAFYGLEIAVDPHTEIVFEPYAAIAATGSADFVLHREHRHPPPSGTTPCSHPLSGWDDCAIDWDLREGQPCSERRLCAYGLDCKTDICVAGDPPLGEPCGEWTEDDINYTDEGDCVLDTQTQLRAVCADNPYYYELLGPKFEHICQNFTQHGQGAAPGPGCAPGLAGYRHVCFQECTTETASDCPTYGDPPSSECHLALERCAVLQRPKNAFCHTSDLGSERLIKCAGEPDFTTCDGPEYPDSETWRSNYGYGHCRIKEGCTDPDECECVEGQCQQYRTANGRPNVCDAGTCRPGDTTDFAETECNLVKDQPIAGLTCVTPPGSTASVWLVEDGEACSSSSQCLSGLCSGGVCAVPLPDRITVSNVTVPEGVKAGVQTTWRIWGYSSFEIAPVYTVPLADCGTLVCYTTMDTNGNPTAQVTYLDPNDAAIRTINVGTGRECRGLAAEPSGGYFAALVWDDANDRIYVDRFDLDGNRTWTVPTELTNPDPPGDDPGNRPASFDLGDSRLEYGNGAYGAYYHVVEWPDPEDNLEHRTDTYKMIDAVSGAESTIISGREAGCGHPMSLLLRYNAGFGAEGFLPVCVTDCYPGTTDPASTPIGGIYLLSSVSLPVGTPPKIMDVHGNCASLVSAELGSAALAPDGWKVVFNGPRDAVVQGGDAYSSSTMNQDVGFVSVTSGPTAGAVVWLTTTPGDEADASIARWETPESSLEQYLVGWLDTDTSQHFLRVVDANGANVDGDYDITAIAQWGSRDDPFRQHFNGDIVWAWFDAAGDSVLHFARVDSRGSYACQTF